ncbi:glycoside hydrolase family 16 protein [Paxillus involutus ATCC 200175]|nr:glycoside hydrolase family 16 protein [Paxillus involutus ATCC 200175]
MSTMSPKKPTVLLVNDDGPPGAESPYILGLYRHLTVDLNWDVKVVVPSSQKSWIGKAYHIAEITRGKYFYPRRPDGVQGETSDTPRELQEDEIAEWILMDGTPATCANVALHNLYPGEIDLVISGPNFGRNTSAAFSLSSGTIGAAMDGALSRTRAIAISYGNVLHPTPVELHEPAHKLSIRIIEYLWTNWGKDPAGMRDGEVDLYNVNLPMIHKLAEPEGLQVYWTHMWRNSYARLFKAVTTVSQTTREIPPEGPNSVSGVGNIASDTSAGASRCLLFKFAPDIQALVTPDLSTVPVGTDGWAFGMGHASVTPMRACFAEVGRGEVGNTQNEGAPLLLKL